MKRKMLTFVSLAIITLVACNKDEVDPVITPAGYGSAVLEGTIYAPLDLSNDTTAAGVFILGLNNEYAPIGTKLTAIIDSEDLQSNPQAGYDYQKLKYTTTVKENGRYIFANLPATNADIHVELRFSDFEGTQIQFDPSNNPAEEKIFTADDATVAIYNGGTLVREFEYHSN